MPSSVQPLRPVGRLEFVVVVSLVAALIVLGLAVADGPLQIDLAIAAAIAPAWPAVATELGNLLGSLPIAALIGIVAATASWTVGRRGTALAFVVALAGELPVTIVKAVVDRPRPPGGIDIEAIGSVASYPSGHTVRAVVIGGLLLATVVWTSHVRIRQALAIVGAGAIVGLVGMARIASGEHWPTDVLGGVLLGGAWLTISLTVARVVDGRRTSGE
jgi:undecaprenyl-diphosphatase